MGTIDPPPGTSSASRPVRPTAPATAKPAVLLPPVPTLGLPGVLGILVGLAFFGGGAFAGWNVIYMGIGAAFVAAGWATRKKPPKKLCPACRFEIPLEASVCGYCHLTQEA